jgi:hypothetical protein
MPSVTISKIRKPANGKIYVRLGKQEFEWNSLAEMKRDISSRFDKDDLMLIAMVMMLKRQPLLDNPTALEGLKLNIDLTLDAWGTVG